MRPSRGFQQIRFVLGMGMGIAGLGEMSHGIFPLSWFPLVLGTGLVGVGTFLSLGVLAQLRRRNTKRID